MSFIRKTTRVVGMNPVTRAVAYARLRSTAQKFQIRLYILEDGEKVEAEIETALLLFDITLKAQTLDKADLDPIIRGAYSAAVQCRERGYTWRKQDATALDRGIARVLEIYPKLNPRSISAAWNTL